MRILQLMDFPVSKIEKYINEGGEYHEHNLYGYMLFKRNGIDITWLAPNHNNIILKFLQNKLGLGYNVMRLYPQIACLWKCKNYDVIYVPHDMHLLVLSIFRMLKICRKPIYVVCHFSYNLKFVDSRFKKIYKAIERFFVYNGVDIISFSNKHILRLAMEDFKVPVRHRTYVNWGANVDFFNTKPCQTKSSDYFLAAGNANRDYNTLIKAFDNIDCDLKLFTSKTKNEFNCMYMSDRIEFINLFKFGISGIVHLREYYQNSIAILIPILESNDVPNGSTVLIEALAVGKPIIITDFETNYIDVEKERIGFKIKRGDSIGWSNSVKYLLANPKEAKEMGQRAKDLSFNKFNYKAFADNVLEGLENLCQSVN